MIETALILYLSGIPLSAVYFAKMFKNLPLDRGQDGFDLDFKTIEGKAAYALFVLLWPIVLVGMIYFYLTER